MGCEPPALMVAALPSGMCGAQQPSVLSVAAQHGPYRFLQNEMKLNATWSEDGDIVRYNRWDYYTPVQLNETYWQVCVCVCVECA